nr:FKBP-type peptidyl-prolyl cis-trans isomerase [uncultured Dyadobacter sp.]
MLQSKSHCYKRRLTCLILVLLPVWLAACSGGNVRKTHSGLQYTKLKKGKGPKAKAGQEILLFETTSYRNGTVLYSNEHSTTPVKVLIGGNQATQAVDEALRGMRAGEVKQIVAPPHLVKRTNYPPNVHPDSTLVIKLILDKIL